MTQVTLEKAEREQMRPFLAPFPSPFSWLRQGREGNPREQPPSSGAWSRQRGASEAREGTQLRARHRQFGLPAFLDEETGPQGQCHAAGEWWLRRRGRKTTPSSTRERQGPPSLDSASELALGTVKRGALGGRTPRPKAFTFMHVQWGHQRASGSRRAASVSVGCSLHR